MNEGRWIQLKQKRYVILRRSCSIGLAFKEITISLYITVWEDEHNFLNENAYETFSESQRIKTILWVSHQPSV